ncbi:hypothetical protein [uncultured Nocardioides sp.]|uniref:hypothetical protein n=1 Tax=uncultured Nocardioides sp. TaxID=198441 RepID=UPI00261B2155|nr:hypothetical protein [uncultured Nocardioides sp.]
MAEIGRIREGPLLDEPTMRLLETVYLLRPEDETALRAALGESVPDVPDHSDLPDRLRALEDGGFLRRLDGRLEYESPYAAFVAIGEARAATILAEATLVGAGPGGHRAPPHPGQRAHLRQHQPGRGRQADEDGRGGPRGGRHDQPDEREGAGEGLDEDDGALAGAVGDGSGDGGADGVGDGQGAGGEAAEAVGVGGPGDEQQGAQLAHGEGQAAEEGDDDVRRAGEADEASVGTQG